MYSIFRNILFCLVCLFLSLGLYSQGRSDLEAKRKEKLKEIAKIQEMIDKTKNERNQGVQNIGLLNRKIAIRNEVIESLSSEISDIETTIGILSEDITDKNTEVKRLKDEYARIVYSSYFQSKNFNKLLFIFSATSFNQAYRRIYFLKQYTTHRKNVLISIYNEITSIEGSIKELRVEKDKKTVLLANRESETKMLESDKAEQSKLIGECSKREVNLKTELKELQAATRKIEQEIERIIKEEAIARQKRSKKAVSDDIVLTNSFSGNKGKFPWPVSNGSVISYFGEHPHPVFKGITIKNNGIDISTNCNSSVSCIFNGVVSKIFAIKGANYAIIVRHGDFLTVYQNIQKVTVKPGEIIKTKQIVGYSFCNDENQLSTVHFEIWQELNKLNPLDWLLDK